MGFEPMYLRLRGLIQTLIDPVLKYKNKINNKPEKETIFEMSRFTINSRTHKI